MNVDLIISLENGKKIELSEEEARSLFQKLRKLFDEPVGLPSIPWDWDKTTPTNPRYPTFPEIWYATY